jgi:subtilisin-like proprotein convertase family protein
VPIPDGTADGPGHWGQPLDIGLSVSGLSGNISDISVSMDLQHPYAGDLEAVLIPPTGSGKSPFVLFSQIGQQLNNLTWASGSPLHFSSDLSGNNPATYVFSDAAVNSLWAAAGFNTATGTFDYSGTLIPGGSYRTSVSGPWDLAGNPNGGNHNAGQFTSFATDSGFVGLSPAQANGQWTVEFRDDDLQDVGHVYGVTLNITAVPEPAAWSLVGGLTLLGFGLGRRLWKGLPPSR